MQILIPGAFNHFKEIINIISKFPKLKGKVEVYDGIENSKWSGGRIDCLAPTFFDLNKIKFYNSFGIGVSITFSNKIIDINSPRENKILEFLNEGKNNGVIIQNELLRQHIRKNFQNLSVQFSVTGVKGDDFKQLIKKEPLYDAICPRPEFVFNNNFISKCNPNKYKIMVNNVCNINCEFWDLHRDAVSDAARKNISNYKKAFLICECWKKTGKIVTPNLEKSCKKFNGDFNKIDVDYGVDDIKKLMEFGFTRFKISGRELKGKIFTDEIEQYIRRILN